MSASQVIVLAMPVFLLLIALEFAWGLARERRRSGRNTYRLSDLINSISLGMLSQLSGVFSSLLTIGIYSAVYASVALFPDQAFWHSVPGVLLALLFYDFCYYWLHRGGHRVALLWAAHSVHHRQNEKACLGGRIPDADFGVLRQRDAEIGQHAARVLDRARAIGRGLVPDRRQAEHFPRVAGA